MKSPNEISWYIIFENTIPHFVAYFVLEAVVQFLTQIILQMSHHEDTALELTTTRKLFLELTAWHVEIFVTVNMNIVYGIHFVAEVYIF